MESITLTAGSLHLEVLPSLGGAVTRFTAGDFPVFRPTPATPASVSDCASFPLIPFSNRIRNGRFRFSDAEVQIPVDKRDARFTNHGHTRHLPWQIVSVTPANLTLRFTHSAPEASWPFPFTAEQYFSLTPSRLTMRARIRNDHKSPAPGGIGFHPYFTRMPGSTLGFSAGCIWETDEVDIPIRSATPAGRFDFSTPKMLESHLINHAYGGWNGAAEITHPSGPRLTINASGTFNHLIFFTPEGKDFFGFEPVSHRPDALNPLPDAKDEGITILNPGNWLEASMDVTIQET
jgi:aldose 1-epimerase